MENSDWTCIINPEVKSDTGELFLIFKLLKRRYRSLDGSEKLRRLDYFAHPFEVENEIKLIDDFDMQKPLSLESLATQFEAVDDKRGKKNVVEREEAPKKKKKNEDFSTDMFNPFDMDTAVNF